MKSIMQNNKCCYVCGSEYNLHEHHIYYGTGNRSISEKNGFKCYLCAYHHNFSDEGVHFNKQLDLQLKKECQEIYEENHTRNEFIKLIGRNYLD